MPSEVAVDKPINLFQLSREVSVEDPPAFRLSGGVLWSDMGQAELEAAVDAHVADPSIVPPPPPAPLVEPEDRLDEDEQAARLRVLASQVAVLQRAVGTAALLEARTVLGEMASIEANPELRRELLKMQLAGDATALHDEPEAAKVIEEAAPERVPRWLKTALGVS